MKTLVYLFFFFTTLNSTFAQIIQEFTIGNELIDEDGLGIIKTNEEEFYILSTITVDTFFDDFQTKSLTIIKMNNENEVIWQNSYGALNSDSSVFHDVVIDFIQLENENILVYLHRYEFGFELFSNIILLEINPEGDLVNEYLVHEYFPGLSRNNKSGKLISTLDGGFMLCSIYFFEIGFGELVDASAIYMIKLDENFEEVWREYSNTNFTYPNVLELENDVFYFVFGEHVVMLDENLNFSLQESYSDQFQQVNSIPTVTGFISFGHTEHISYSFDYQANNIGKIIKYDDNLNLEWEKEYLTENYFSINHLVELADGYIIAGAHKFPDSIFYDNHQPFIAKIDSQGQVVWEKVLQNYEIADFKEFIYQADGRITLVGNTMQNSSDILIVDFQTEERISSHVEDDFSVILSPNPVKDYLKLNIQIEQNHQGLVEFILYDKLGRIVLNDQVIDDNFILDHSIDISSLQSGVYYLILQVGTHTAKIPVLKY